MARVLERVPMAGQAGIDRWKHSVCSLLCKPFAKYLLICLLLTSHWFKCWCSFINFSYPGVQLPKAVGKTCYKIGWFRAVWRFPLAEKKGEVCPTDRQCGIIFLEEKLPPNSEKLLFGLFSKILNTPPPPPPPPASHLYFNMPDMLFCENGVFRESFKDI